MVRNSNKYLTGFTKYRKGWFGKLILQVWEVTEFENGPSIFNWRDATADDIVGWKNPARLIASQPKRINE